MIYQSGREIESKKVLRLLRVAFLCFLFTSVPSVAFAVNLDVTFLQTFESSSNLSRVEDALNDQGQYEELINTSSVSFKVNKEFSSVKGFLDLNFRYVDYENNLSRDTARNTLSTEMLWTISRGFYSWYFEDQYSQIRDDPTEIISANNTQNVNVFVTGPKFEWKIGVSNLVVESLLTNYVYSESEADNTSITSEVSWGASLTGGITADLRYTSMFLNYDESDALEGYDQSIIGLGLRYVRSVNSLDAFYGKTYLNPGDVDKKTFATTNIVFKRQISKLNNFSLSYKKTLANQNTSIDSDVVSLSGPVIKERSNIQYHKESSGFSMDFKYSETTSRVVGGGGVDDSVESQVSITREMALRSQLRILYKNNQRVSSSVLGGYEDNTFVSKIEYKKRLNNKFSLLVFISETLNESETVSRQYVDNRIGLTFSISR